MKDCRQFYIDGAWVDPSQSNDLMVENPATEQTVAVITDGSMADVNLAITAARRTFDGGYRPSRDERVAMMEKIIEIYKERYDEMAEAISLEMGAPISWATAAQAGSGLGHLQEALEVLKSFKFEDSHGKTRILKEPIGVCGMITPWNWPINQITCKIAPALATGCTMVLKPSEVAPLSGYLMSDIIHQAGVPAGVYNMVNGTGAVVGSTLSSHPDIDMVSFTGSTRAGVLVAKAAADTVKRVAQELGGKSPNIILDDADLEEAVTSGVQSLMSNTGQSCNAPSRMLVQADQYEAAVAIAKQAAESITVDEPTKQGAHIGPLSSRMQFDKVQGLIQTGIDEGGRLVAGGVGRPDGLDVGYYAKPTVFADITPNMTLFTEEVFGPVLVMVPYKDEEDAIRLANDTPYGLAGYVQSGDQERALRVASRIRAGMLQINGANREISAPFGGYKQSGNGREWGELGFEDFLEVKAVSL